MIAVGAFITLSGFATFLLQESAFEQAREQAERAGVGAIPGVSEPDTFVIVGPLFFTAPIVALGVILILLSRDSGRRIDRLL